MGQRLGNVTIDVCDIVGYRFGTLDVISYSGKVYDYTKAGPRARHYYTCVNAKGRTKVVERSNILRGERRDGN